MTTIILVAGGTGALGQKIVASLIQNGAEVRVPVRATADPSKVDKLKQTGATVIVTDKWDLATLTEACQGVSCVVSALQGLRDVIVDAQLVLLNAAVAAGVPRFIPSDFSTDFTKLSPGDNRNFDLRREFHEQLYKSSIQPTSIFNGAFAELLSRNIPLLNFKDSTVGYLEDADWYIDFTTMDNTASFTALAALDPDSPKILRIASFQVTANEVAAIASEVTKQPLKTVRMAGRDEFAARVKADRAANPAGEQELYARWQQAQYIHSMFSAHHDSLDNDRYAEIQWTGMEELLASNLSSKRS